MIEKKETLLAYMKVNVAPILVDFMNSNDFEGAVVLPANIDIKDLNGHYTNKEYLPPKWYNRIVNSKENKILVIDKIDTIPKEEQIKFCEILKHRQVSTFELPDNCRIIVTAKEIKKEKIDRKILSLVAII